MEQETQGPGQQNPQRVLRQNTLLSISRVHLHSRRTPSSQGHREKGKQTASRQVVPPGTGRRAAGDPCWKRTLTSSSRGRGRACSGEGRGTRWRTENLRQLVSSEAKQELEASLQRRTPESCPISSASTGRGSHRKRICWCSLTLRPALASMLSLG